MNTCSVTGYLYKSNGDPAAGQALWVKKSVQNGELISSEPKLYKADDNGLVTFNLPQDAYNWIWSEVSGLDRYPQGTVLYSGTASEYSILDLFSISGSVELPDLVPVLYYPQNTGMSGYSGRSGFSGYSGLSGAGQSGYSGYSGTNGQSGFSGYSGYGNQDLETLFFAGV